MKFLLDTDTVVDHIRGKQKIPDVVITQGIGISIITYGELVYGAWKSTNKDQALKIIEELITGFPMTIVPLNQSIVESFGKIKAKLESDGNKVADFDLLIGLTAQGENLSLITKNLKHFKRIPHLKITSL